MSSRIGVVPKRLVATLVAFVFALCVLGTYATAQVAIQPKDELSVGYTWLHPGGHYDLGIPTQDVTTGIDFSVRLLSA